MTPTASTREGRSYADPAGTCEPPGPIRLDSPGSPPGWVGSPLGGNFLSVFANLFPPSGELPAFLGMAYRRTGGMRSLARSPRSAGRVRACCWGHLLSARTPSPPPTAAPNPGRPTTPDTRSGARTRYCVTQVPSWCPRPPLLVPTRVATRAVSPSRDGVRLPRVGLPHC